VKTALRADHVKALTWLSVQATNKVPVLFNPAGAYDAQAVLLVSLAETPITLTAEQVVSMPWKQFVRLMKVRRLPQGHPSNALLGCLSVILASQPLGSLLYPACAHMPCFRPSILLPS
jgi:hypothetical protein